MLIEEVKKLSPLDRLLYWIREREIVRLKKEAGESPPWTDDKIIGGYRFCNIRRMDDKVSKWLLTNWYEPFYDHPNMLYATALARFVNLPSSLYEVVGWILTPEIAGTKDKPFWERIKAILREIKRRGETVFNGAYMVRGNTKKSPDKIGTVVDEYIGALVEAGIEIDRTSMEATHARIKEVYGFGSFMAGQVVADLRWAVEGSWADRNSWAPIGPGSARGMNRVHSRPIKEPLTQEQFLGELCNLIKDCKKELPRFVTIRMEAHDYQNCLCEFDKYERALWGDGKPKQKYVAKRGYKGK